jgi:hypothetical protein
MTLFEGLHQCKNSLTAGPGRQMHSRIAKATGKEDNGHRHRPLCCRIFWKERPIPAIVRWSRRRDGGGGAGQAGRRTRRARAPETRRGPAWRPPRRRPPPRFAAASPTPSVGCRPVVATDMRWTSGLLEQIGPAYGTIVKSRRVTKPNPFYDRSRQGTDPTWVAAGLGSVRLTDGSRTLIRVDPATARIVKRTNLRAPLDGVAVGVVPCGRSAAPRPLCAESTAKAGRQTGFPSLAARLPVAVPACPPGRPGLRVGTERKHGRRSQRSTRSFAASRGRSRSRSRALPRGWRSVMELFEAISSTRLATRTLGRTSSGTRGRRSLRSSTALSSA